MIKFFSKARIFKYYFFNKEKFIEKFSKKNFKKSFFSYHFRPKKMDKMIDDSIKIKDKIDRIGIVIQGPLKLEDNFTYETLKYYREIYKNCNIILSTWDDESKEELDKIKKLGIEVLINKKPENSDINNLSYQVITTQAGINLAKKQNCKYILKTRTDFRIYDTGVDKFLISLLKIYPSNTIHQKERIIGIGLNIRSYDPSFSDLFQFGTIEEMEKMWDVKLNLNKTSAKIYENISKEEFSEILKNDNAIKRYNKITYTEGYLLKNYLEKINVSLGKNLESYYKVLKDNFIIIDMSMINLYWNKYSKEEYKNLRDYESSLDIKRMRFKDWQIIYYYDIYEINQKLYEKSLKELKSMTIEDFK